MAELIVGGACEAEFFDEIVFWSVGFVGVKSTVIEVWRPHGELYVKTGEASFFHLVGEPFEGVCRFFNSAKTVDEVFDIVNHEHWFAVDFIVVGQLEIKLYVALADALKLLATHFALPDYVVFVDIIKASVPEVEHIVVCPHEIEFHFLVVGCL